jgi:hypothetical protein
MANVKITELPSATSITPSTDVLPIVSSNITSKVTPDQLFASPGAIGSTTPNTGVFSQLNLGTAQDLIWGAGLNNMTASDGSGYFLNTDGSFIIQQNGAGLPPGPFFAVDQYGSLGLGTLFANYYGPQARCITLDGDGITTGVIDFRNQGTQVGAIEVTTGIFNIHSNSGFVQIASNLLGSMDNIAIGGKTPAAGNFTSLSTTTSAVFQQSSLFKNLTGGNYIGISGAGGATQPILKINANDAGQQISFNINSVDGTTGASLSINGITGQPGWTIDSYGNIFPRQGTTTQTNGFFYIPSCSGAPTGVPAVENAGITCLMYDETNNYLYAYNGGWKKIGPFA